MTLPSIDQDYMLDFLTALLNTPSPTGFTEAAIEYTEQALQAFPEVICSRTRKGGLLVKWIGEHDDHPRALTAHVDTLGAMVKEIKGNGRLKLTKLGGYAWNTVEGEGVTVFTSDGNQVRGSLLLCKSSSHVHGAATNETKRDDDAMEVRLDAITHNAEDTKALGIQVGVFVAFDPRVEVTNGFIRSRHLDDKACVANLV
ncbi:MAG: peptidase M42, partial [Anaerolineaceae bacterium]|nr:peptidase M42 [Anaerolineaceae bacterium]